MKHSSTINLISFLTAMVALGIFVADLAGHPQQTVNTYTLPTGTVCSSTEGPEFCYYEIADGAHSGVFMATGPYDGPMQFQYRAFPGQNPGYDAEYCNTQFGNWTKADTPDLGPTAALFTMNCVSHNLANEPSTMHAEVYAHSYVATYTCGGRVRTTCHQARWAIDDGSYLAITK